MRVRWPNEGYCATAGVSVQSLAPENTGIVFVVYV